jgi:hypothetical protein
MVRATARVALATIRKDFVMWPIPYTGLKTVHDQEIKEALEHSRFSAEQATQKRHLRQTLSAFLARFTHSSAQKPEATLPACDREAKETVC